jgi:hypothetical protein
MAWANLDPLTPANLNRKSQGSVVNVRDGTYGADPAGTESGASIQAAANAAATVSGTLFFPAGQYLTHSAITLGNNVTVRGEGSASVLSSAASNFGAQVGIFNVSDVSGVRVADMQLESSATANGISFHGCNDCVVEGMTVVHTGNGPNVACVGIYDGGTGSALTFKNFQVRNNLFKPSHLGVLAQGNGTGPEWLESVQITNNVIDCSNNSIGDGIIKVDLQVSDFAVTGNIINGAHLADEGINVQETITNGVIANNVIRALDERGIVVQEGQTSGTVQNIVISGNVIEDCVLNGIEIAPNNDSVFTGIIVANNSIHSVGGNGIRASTTTVWDLIIADNVITEHKGYGMLIGNPDTIIRGNKIRTSTNDADSESLRITATGVRVHDNVLLSTNNSNVTFSSSVAAGATSWINNAGLKSEATGIGTVLDGSATTTITHGLHVTPNQVNFIVTPANASGASQGFFVDAVGATTFDITLDANAGGAAAFSWMALRRGVENLS